MEVTKGDKVFNLKTIQIQAKCSDMCSCELIDSNGKTIIESNDYSPNFLGGGDYISLDIDADTGEIKGWVNKKENIQDYINSREENLDEEDEEEE